MSTKCSSRFGGIGRRTLAILILVSITRLSGLQAASVTVLIDSESPPALFASDEIQEALQAKGYSAKRSNLTQLDRVTDDKCIVLCLRSDAEIVGKMLTEGGTPPGNLKSEGYSIRTTSKAGRTACWVIAEDTAGVIYGGLELAEIIRLDGFGGINEVDQNPYMAMRGTKFNIPLDARTPSYSDVSDAAQNNIIEMWNLDFWKEYIDNLARYRYNFISLWSLHPFPSMVKVPDYPDVALDDVKRSTVQWNEFYPGNGTGFNTPEIMNNLETLKKMTIEEKIEFWRKVMRYAKDRNIDFYVVTWNIFVYGVGGKYGITDNINNETTIDYFRKSVKQMFLTYPDLAGIGLTTGENMGGANFSQKEDWAFKTYAQGVLDVAKEQPGRKITLIHRQHQTGAKDIARQFAPLINHKDIEFIFSFKYAKAHVYSSTTQPYHHDFVKDIGNLKTIWTLRNDDVYHFRWGGPDFVREFIKNIPYEVSKGFYLGSDQYIWGREFLSTEPETPRQIEIVKHWYHWMIWGRLAYNPNLSNERFIKIIQQRYPVISGADLFTAWQEASMVYPKTTGFHWGALDFQWYIEACKSRPGPAKTPTGFHDVNRFISLPPHLSTDYVSIPEYVDNLVEGKEPTGATPIDVSNQIHEHADKALQILGGLSHGGDKELRLTLGDIRAIAYLGKYYAHKIHGATELALFRKSKKQERQNAAIEELTRAAQYWRLYASTALCQYKNPLWTNRVGYCDWRELFNEVLNDIRIAGGSLSLPSMYPTSGGTILEAEKASYHGPQKAVSSSGYTGTGYLDFDGAADESWVEWTFDAPQGATYILEIRYAGKLGQYPSAMTVNGQGVGDFVLWTTGGKSTWAWDRKAAVLRKGANTISLTPKGSPLIDHLNVLYSGLDVRQKPFGRTPDGHEVTIYQLTNANGLRASVIDYGAILVSLEVPDRNGKLADVALGFDDLDSYVKRNPLFGATVGRYANRIANAKFTLDGVEYKLTANAGKNHIHGGRNKRFDKVMWKGCSFRDEQEVAVGFHYASKDGEEGFAGNLDCTVTYALTNNDELKISYEATTDKPTIVNLTNHSYFNLAGAGSGDVLGHEITINANFYTPADKALIPTGEIHSVKGTALDFTHTRAIGARIDELTQTRGYDHNYVLNSPLGSLALAARVYEPRSGRVMEVYTTEPGMQFYTANGMRQIKGKGGKIYDRHYGFCLETQHFPDSPNKPHFPSVVLRPGEKYDTKTVFKFSTRADLTRPSTSPPSPGP